MELDFFFFSLPGSTLKIVFLIAAIPDPELHLEKPATRGSCAKQAGGGVAVKVLYIYSWMFLLVLFVLSYSTRMYPLITSDHLFQWCRDSQGFKCTNENEPDTSALDT